MSLLFFIYKTNNQMQPLFAIMTATRQSIVYGFIGFMQRGIVSNFRNGFTYCL